MSFTDDGIERIAELAWEVNEKTENIGARRLHTMLEKLLEQISYEAGSEENLSVTVDKDYVNEQLSVVAEDEDLSRYIL